MTLLTPAAACPPDLIAVRAALRAGRGSAQAEMLSSIARAQSAACAKVFLKPQFDEALAAAAAPGIERQALAGLAVSVKDLFDIAGQTTAAGSAVLDDAPPAPVDCPAVARLKAAGGVVIGRTNMSEFAFSGVGTNPHFGTPANAASQQVALIPGGSSSGAAVSVATGAAFVGLGSDTGGSIRIPAALNGIVGFKSTARWVPTQGVLPLSGTLDTVCAVTRSVRDAILVHEILAARRVTRSLAPLRTYRLAVIKPLMQDDLDATVASAWQRSLDNLRAGGTQIDEIDLPLLAELPALQAGGGFPVAESFAWHRRLMERDAARYDPRVLARIQRGAAMRSHEYLDLHTARRDWIARMEAAFQNFDAVLSPTVPIVAPSIASVAPGGERDEAFFKVNALLLRNTSVVNMLDGCAMSLPCHAPGELPVGLMVWAGALRDDTVLNVATQIEALLQNT
jgi:aspartyl-tRNA(Asn)/glutamyl-tRNA(Gln) amidotransferase subunit A